jgi:hypothetical protein
MLQNFTQSAHGIFPWKLRDSVSFECYPLATLPTGLALPTARAKVVAVAQGLRESDAGRPCVIQFKSRLLNSD